MPQESGYRKTVPQTLIDLLKTNLPENTFLSYYEGDPILIPASLMPACVISESQTDYDTGPTGFDEIKHTLLIQVVFNKKDEIGKPDNQVTMDRMIDQVCQGRDETTGDFLPSSIMSILRRNITLGNLAIENISRVRKGIIPRSEELLTAEGHIELTVSELQQVSNRT